MGHGLNFPVFKRKEPSKIRPLINKISKYSSTKFIHLI